MATEAYIVAPCTHMPRKYLERYASPETALAASIAAALDASGTEHYDHVVVTPAYDESIELIDGVLSGVDAKGRVLCVLVVNARSDAPQAARLSNETLLRDVRSRSSAARELDNAWLCRIDEQLDILAIDRTSDGHTLPAKQGVGMARRIGCDVALALRHAGRVASRWIHTTDADVTLPSDYFSAATALAGQKDLVALTYPFWHDTDPATSEGRALELYELSLRYYVLGLRWCGSAYAFHTVGSTLAVDALAYAKVRGVPLRQAGEDFYLLNKLAKLGEVRTPDSSPIRIRQRTSTRVPFGTGPATRRIAEMLERGEDMGVYHPAIFDLLRKTLVVTRRAAHRGETCAIDHITTQHRTALRAAWARTQLEQGVADVGANATTPAARERRFDGWFDGFRTLAFIHAARDSGLANVPWREAFDQATFVPSADSDAFGYRQQLLYLEQGRE